MPVLDDGVKDLHAGGPRELSQLRHRSLAVEQGVRLDAYQYGPLGGIHPSDRLPSRELFIESLYEFGEIQVCLGDRGGVHQDPVFAPGIFGDQVRRVHPAGEAVPFDLDGRDHVETKEGQVGQVVPRQVFSVEVGVDKAQTLQASGGCPETPEIRDDDLPVIPDDYPQNLSPAADKDACLPACAVGNAGNLSCNLMGDYPLRGYPSPVKPLDIPEITRLQTRYIAMDFFNFSPRGIGRIRQDPVKQPF